MSVAILVLSIILLLSLMGLLLAVLMESDLLLAITAIFAGLSAPALAILGITSYGHG